MKLLFFDIDGTLAIGKQVPQSTQEALRKARDKGTITFACTGRNVVYAKRNFHEYVNGFVCNNGRLAVMGCCGTFFDAPLTKEELTNIIEKLDSVNAGYVFHGREKGYYGGNEDGFEPIGMVSDPGYMEKGIDVNTVKVYNFDVWFKDLKHRKKIEEVLDGICLLNPHGPHPTADMTVIGVDKGSAIKAVAKEMGVAIEDTYAFGDGVNDICMLEAAGHGIAMGNAVDETKAAAEYVTTNIDDDGIKNALAHYQLI